MGHRREPLLAVALLAVVAVFAAALGLAGSTAARAPGEVLVIEGEGFGHGVGMAQDGAAALGRMGWSSRQIIGHFYPGAAIASKPNLPVRVAVLDAGGPGESATLAFPGGGGIHDRGGNGNGFPVRVAPGGRVRLVWDGHRTSVEGGTPSGSTAATGPASSPKLHQPAQVPPPDSTPPGSTTTTTTSTTQPLLPRPTTTTTTTTTTRPPRPEQNPPPGPEGPGPEPAPPSAPPPSSTGGLRAVPDGGSPVEVVARARAYRGVIDTDTGSGRLRLLNELDVETYLKGMAEVRDPGWPAAGLQAQAIAARTYALRAMEATGEICDTQRCQVYFGTAAEFAQQSAAVDATRGQVLVHRGRLAAAVYSANAAGHTASREEGFGVVDDASAPYLRPVRYDSPDPLPWGVRYGLDAVAARLGYPGSISAVEVVRVGPSGRALEIAIQGSAGPVTVGGLELDRSLGLRSTRLTALRIEAGGAPPEPLPPPEEAARIQVAPELTGPVADSQARRLSTAATSQVAGEAAARLGLATRLTIAGAVLVLGAVSAAAATTAGRRFRRS